MRLYLSSFRMGRHADRLVSMATGGRKVLIVMNSCDMHPAEGRAERLAGEMAALGELGFEPDELDLREYFDHEDSGRLERRLRSADVVWVRGGNVFVLLRAMKRSRLDEILPRLLEEDCFVYGGYSAGVGLLMRDLRGVDLVDDVHDVPEGYPPHIVWTGIGVLPFAVAPHYRSEHSESDDVERLVQYYIDRHILFVALRDGEVIIQDHGREMTILGLEGESTMISGLGTCGRR